MRRLCSARVRPAARSPAGSSAADALSDARRLVQPGSVRRRRAGGPRCRAASRRLPMAHGSCSDGFSWSVIARLPRRDDLADAIAALRAVDARPLDAARADRTDDRDGRGALPRRSISAPRPRCSSRSSIASSLLGPPAHERVLDWWATALDRQALARPAGDRPPIYGRIATRMAAEIAKDAGSAPAGYWLAAATRGAGDLDGAMNEATAGWVRAALARDRGAALRADLDRLVVQGILPDRAARSAGTGPRAGARRDGWRVGSVQGALVTLNARRVDRAPVSSSLPSSSPRCRRRP